MAKQHGHKLAPTRKAAGVSFGTGSVTARSNSVRENNCNIWLKMLDTRVTAVVALPMVYVFSTQTVAEFYRRLPRIWATMHLAE
jgi:hypothetical protein